MASPLDVQLILCDAAQADAGSGKVHMLGAGWSITSSPTSHAVALLIKVPWDRANERLNLTLELRDADGGAVLLPTANGNAAVRAQGELRDGPTHCNAPAADLQLACVDSPRDPRGGNAMRSRHPSGVQAVFCDGRVTFFSNSIDKLAYRAQFTIQGGEAVTSQLLSAAPQIDAIWNHDDDQGVGVLAAIDAAGRDEFFMVGGAGSANAMRAIQSGDSVLEATVIYPSTQAADGIALARLIAQGKTMSDLYTPSVPNRIVLDAPVVTADNVDEFIEFAFES